MQKKNFLLFQEIYIAANHVSEKDLFVTRLVSPKAPATYYCLKLCLIQFTCWNYLRF